jgi:hypothetical protein
MENGEKSAALLERYSLTCHLEEQSDEGSAA